MDILGVIALIAGIGMIIQIIVNVIKAFSKNEGHITPNIFLVTVFCIATWNSLLVLAIIAIVLYVIVLFIDITANS